jgi:poly-gamma-glutamate system protein
MVQRPQAPLRYAGYHPLVSVSWKLLFAGVALSVAAWVGIEAWKGSFTHASYTQMMRSAHTMESASQVIRGLRTRLGLMQPRTVDPNQTGLIGSEYTDTTTSLGDLVAKRTATNPDLAAAITRRLHDLNLPAGSRILVVVSGSFVGANIAAIIAIEALGHRPVVISSLGASMFGATDARLTWLDIEAELRRAGVIRVKSSGAVIGGGSATGGGLADAGIEQLRDAAKRNDVPLFEAGELAELLHRIETTADAVSGDGIALLVNSGGSVIALGTCEEGGRIATLVVDGGIPCTSGVPGLIVRAARRGLPVLHLLNIKGLAAEWDLPFDPIPLPTVGNNRFVYGATPPPR